MSKAKKYRYPCADAITLYCVAGCTPAIRVPMIGADGKTIPTSPGGTSVRMRWAHPEHIVIDARAIAGRARMQTLRELQAARALEELREYLAND